MGVTVRAKSLERPHEYWIFVTHAKRRRSIKVGPKKEAEKLADVIRGQIAAGKVGLVFAKKTTAPIFEKVCKKWLENEMPAKCRISTQVSYRSIYRKHLKNVPFRNKPLDEITRGEIKDYLYLLLKSMAASSVAHIRNAISGIFSVGIDHKWCENNPARGISVRKPGKKMPTPWGQDEVNQLLDTIIRHKHYALVATLLMTGARIGEVVGMRVEDLDFVKREWHLQRSYSFGRMGPPKNGLSRMVDLSNNLMEILRQHIGERTEGWVFKNQAGNPIRPDNFRNRHWYQLQERAGVRKLHIHSCRASYCSRAAAAGISLFYIAKQVGHSDLDLLAKRYGFLLPSNGSKPIDKLDKF
ncbi:tyrosine-type recombinase/integrase [Desulfofustis glycolicus]|uniref:Integrase n=1 Tax=Desulfofustis glycolicus DSM 9705 TaxID=1121409 RepID=A0A1M5YU80_9BACT|nr:site-specific integrase [Desulfofustis glycolicus]SHI15677.1 integrase [Desulfofustis glycolicus DSM 9705]